MHDFFGFVYHWLPLIEVLTFIAAIFYAYFKIRKWVEKGREGK